MPKPTGTTGYLPKSIYRTQYSTAGQHLVASSGSEIDIEDGALMEIASGGSIVATSGATLRLETVERCTGKGGAMQPSGVSLIQCTEAPSIFFIKSGFKEGTRKTIIINTSAPMSIKASSHTGGKSVTFNSTQIVITPSSDNLKENKGIVGEQGLAINLIAESSANWLVLNLPCQSTDAATQWTLSSAT